MVSRFRSVLGSPHPPGSHNSSAAPRPHRDPQRPPNSPQKPESPNPVHAPGTAVRTTTEEHGELMRENTPLQTEIPERPGVPQLIAELDGSMIPEVEIVPPSDGEQQVDRRKARK